MRLLFSCMVFVFLHISLFATSTIDLTNVERDWLDNNKIIKLAIDKNFAPFESVDKSGMVNGLAIDYIKEIEKILNIKFEIIKTKDWSKIVKMMKKGEIDLLSCIVKTEKRDKYISYTTPYISIPMVIVTNKMSGFISGLDDLEGKAVAVIDGYTPQELLNMYYPKIHLVKTKNLMEALKLVSTGKTFAHVGNLSRITNLLQNEVFENLTISGITEYKYDFTMGIKKDNEILQSIIEKALIAIPSKVKKEIYNRWFPIDYKTSYDYTLVITIVVFLLLIIVFFILWMWKLKKEMSKRILIEKQLKKNIKWLNSSLKKADVGAWDWDLRTNIITGNSVYANILGLSDDEINITAKEFQYEIIYKEDLPIVLQELECYFNKDKKTCSAKFRVNMKNGKIKMIHSTGEIFKYDNFGNPAIMFGFIKEIDDTL